MKKDEDEDNQSMVQVVRATLGNLCDTETTEATGIERLLVVFLQFYRYSYSCS